jgi:hypothetical protein
MIFQHTHELVLAGKKTQTRRIVKLDDLFTHTTANMWKFYPEQAKACPYTSVSRGGRKIYCINKTYAVQPARNQKAIARIEIKTIRREDVRNINLKDVTAEGFASHREFLKVWCEMHDPRALYMHTEISKETVFEIAARFPKDIAIQYLDGWKRSLEDRPAECYAAWVLTFKLVKAVPHD